MTGSARSGGAAGACESTESPTLSFPEVEEGQEWPVRTTNAFDAAKPEPYTHGRNTREQMKPNNTFFALALFALAAVIVASPAWAQADDGDILSRDAVLRDRDIPDLGNPQGDITIVEYFDYQCPYCKKTAPELAQVAREDGKVRLALKDWPIFGPASTYAAKMALASKFQGKYEEAHDALIAAKAKLTEAAVDDLLAKAGVDVAKATADRDAHAQEIDALLARNDAQARAFGFQGTPGFIIGTFRVPGALNPAGFKHAIADARKAAAGK
jgi:protein-disulfide isomerase